MTTLQPGIPTTLHFKKLTYRVVLAQDFGDNIHAYASHNLGFKSGAFNGNAFNNPPADETTKWERRFLAGTVLAGLCWAAMGTLLLPDSQHIVQRLAVVMMVALLMTGGQFGDWTLLEVVRLAHVQDRRIAEELARFASAAPDRG